MPSPPPIRPKSPGWREFASRYHCPAWPGQPPRRSRQFHRHIARHPQSRRGLLSHEQSMRDGPALRGLEIALLASLEGASVYGGPIRVLGSEERGVGKERVSTYDSGWLANT